MKRPETRRDGLIGCKQHAIAPKAKSQILTSDTFRRQKRGFAGLITAFLPGGKVAQHTHTATKAFVRHQIEKGLLKPTSTVLLGVR